MSPRDILQFNTLMNEGAVDRALAIKGEFAKECQELKSLIDEWDKRGKIDARLKDLAVQTKSFQLESEEFDAAVAEHKKSLAKIGERELACSARESALTAKEADAIRVAQDLVNAKDKHDAQVKADTDAMTAARADIALQQADIAAQRAEIATREKQVADKLKALKALAG